MDLSAKVDVFLNVYRLSSSMHSARISAILIHKRYTYQELRPMMCIQMQAITNTRTFHQSRERITTNVRYREIRTKRAPRTADEANKATRAQSFLKVGKKVAKQRVEDIGKVRETRTEMVPRYQ